MKPIRICSALLAALLALGGLTASANSAQTRWEGVSSTGAIINDGDCPVVVEHELLTFDINSFPTGHNFQPNDFQAYDARVTAQYTFHNPSDDTVTATLLFPFGNMPDYAPREVSDMARYGVAVDGERIEATLRHTYSLSFDQFDLTTDLSRLHDGLAEHPFYTPDLPVTRYTYTVSGVDEKTYPAADVAFHWTDNGATKLWLLDQSGFRRLEDGSVLLSTWAENGRTVTLYALGEGVEPEWTFYSNGSMETAIDGTMTLTNTETSTFRQLALTSWSADSGVSESDWYNAVVAQFDRHEDSYGGGVIGAELYDSSLDMTHRLMYWYEYDITLAPGARITNTVTAPLYPAINERYDPPVYTYTYLLSPAKTWVEFGELDIVVNTSYHLTKESAGDFTETDTGYAMALDGLPDGELEFSLSASARPHTAMNPYLGSFLLFIGAIVALFLLFFLLAVRKRRRSVSS